MKVLLGRDEAGTVLALRTEGQIGCEVPVGSSEWPEGSLTALTIGRRGRERRVEREGHHLLGGKRGRVSSEGNVHILLILECYS